MIKKLLRSIIRVSQWSLLVLSIFPVSTAKAEPVTYTVTGPNDLWFTFTEPSDFRVRTYAQQYGIDSMLWLYDSDGILLAQNDDYFGLDSRLDVPVQSGTYRLRTGVCCWDPNRWYGTSYTLELNSTPSNQPTTTVPETTTTWAPTTTSTEPTTTTTTTVPETTVPVTEPPTTSTTSTTTEVPTTTVTSLPPETTTTTVTVAPTVTSVIPTTSTIGTTVAPTVAPSTVATNTTSAPTVVTPPPVSSTSTTTTVASTSTSTSIPESTSSSTSTTTPTTVPVENGPQITEEDILNLSDEELTNLVESIEVSALTEESISAVFSEEVLNQLTDDQVTELIDSIVPDELTDEQAVALSEALTNAPDDVKQEFESQINVFGGQFDTYVPTGSVISVGQRRVVIAAAASFAMPTPINSRKK